MFTSDEEKQIEKVTQKHNEITLAIKTLSASLSKLEEISKSKEHLIETNFEQLIFRLKNRKITMLDELKQISILKKKILIQQLQQIKAHQKEVNSFKVQYEQMILGESHGMDQMQRKKYITSTAASLLSKDVNLHAIINPMLRIDNFEMDHAWIENMGKINSLNIPYPPHVHVRQCYATSIRIAIDVNNSDDTKDDSGDSRNGNSADAEDDSKHNHGNVMIQSEHVPRITEYKVETKREEADHRTDGSNSNSNSKWETALIIDNAQDTECMLRGLSPNTSYLIRVCAHNMNGWSSYSKCKFLKTKNINKIGQRMIYLAPTPEYQNKLSILMTSYFTKWKGFHITIGGKCKASELAQIPISTTELIQELSEFGEKKSNKKLWRIPNGKWKVLAGKDLIVLGLDDDIPMFEMASKFLESKQWTNVKKKSYHITLGLKRDLNREQIKEMAHILVDQEDPVKWEWVSVKERPDNKICWDQRFPAYQI
mmetsp:Transcript_23413/g.37465  ORF Transcript_23413/g.37465 Transcript_23413/m.37465 type:complete len:483 (-) Transcript_23413:87-1535(-)